MGSDESHEQNLMELENLQSVATKLDQCKIKSTGNILICNEKDVVNFSLSSRAHSNQINMMLRNIL